MRRFMHSLFKAEAGQYWYIGDFTADFQSLESYIQAVVISRGSVGQTVATLFYTEF